MKILVTGGSGFLASHISDKLISSGHEIYIYDKKISKFKNRKQRFIKGDLSNTKLLEKIIKKIDVVYHFAAIADIGEAMQNPADTVKTNILSTVNLLNLSLKHNIKRFIFGSTIYVNSEEGSFYKSSKRAAENYIEEYSKLFGLKFTILRYGSLYGERSNDKNGITKIINHAIKKKVVSYDGSKHTVREYINVKDAAKMSVRCLQKKYENKYIIITGKNKIKINNLLKILKKFFKIKSSIVYRDNKLPGHYIKTPNTYKWKKGIKMIIKNNENFEKDLIKYLKNI